MYVADAYSTVGRIGFESNQIGSERPKKLDILRDSTVNNYYKNYDF